MSVWDDMRALLPDNTEGLISEQDLRDIVTMLETEDSENLKGASLQNIFVNPGGAQDISDIISGITDAASNKRYLIQIMPGEHTTKQVQMKPYVYVVGTAKDAAVITAQNVTDTVFTMSDQSTIENVIVNGASSGIAFKMNVAGHSHWEEGGCTNCATGILVDHADAEVIASVNWNNINGTGFKVTQGHINLLESVVLDDSTFSNLIHITGATSSADIYKCTSYSTNMNTLLKVEAGAMVRATGINVKNADVGLYVSGDSNVKISSSNLCNNTLGASVPDIAGSPIIDLSGVCLLDNTTNATVLNANATVRGQWITDVSNVTVVPGATFVASVVDETEGDEGTHIFGELKVGTTLNPAESCLGEGDSYSGTKRIKVYTYDGASYADVTVAASSPSGSTIQFPNGNVDSAIYMASVIPYNGSYSKHSGFKVNVTTPYDSLADIMVSGTTTPATAGSYSKYTNINGQPAYRRNTLDYWLFFTQGYWVLTDSEPSAATQYYSGTHISTSLNGIYDPITGNGASGTPTVTLNDPASSPFIIERYNGETSTWDEVKYMVTDADNSYQTYADTLFGHTGSFQVRYNLLLENDQVWTVTDPMTLGTSYYWTRIRITSALSSSPVLEQIKIHSNRTEINGDGFIEFFGKARPYKALPWDAGLLNAGVDSPSDQDLYVSDSLERGYIENSFDNATTDRAGFNAYLPNDVDTSTPIRFRWSVASDGSGGDVRWTVRWGYTTDGDSVYSTAVGAPASGPNEQSTVILQTITSADTQYTTYADLDISKLKASNEGASGDILWISLERTGNDAADTHGGNVALINVQPLYASYVLGGHI